MNELQKELQDLKAKVAELEARVVAEHAVKKWTLEGGIFFVNAGGSVSMYDSRVFTKEFGLERQTREQAERAAVEMRRFNRLLALRDELCGDDEVNWSGYGEENPKFSIYFSHAFNKWEYTGTICYECITPYFTAEESAQRACDMLNSGEVEL